MILRQRWRISAGPRAHWAEILIDATSVPYGVVLQRGHPALEGVFIALSCHGRHKYLCIDRHPARRCNASSNKFIAWVVFVF